jgi:HD-like signal output (HDOD) protein
MISQAELDDYISSVPPLPKVVKACSDALEEGDLIKAADEAAKDGALMFYLKELVNKPIFGFRTTIKDSRQLFGALGLSRARQFLYAYYANLLLPQKWIFFDLDKRVFQEFQAHIMVKWERILQKQNIDNDEMLKAASLIPSALAVCENIFKNHLVTIKLIREQKPLSYDLILYKLTKMHFIDVAIQIARKWELSTAIEELLLDFKDTKPHGDLIEYLKLLIQYELSRPELVQSGVNDFFELTIFANDDLIADFYSLIKEDKDATSN